MEKSLGINYWNSLENADLCLEEQEFYFSYVCKVCSQLFEIDSYFVTHLEHHHSKEKKFQLLKYQTLKNNQCSSNININIGFFCKMCSFYEITEKVMKAHMIYIHNLTNEYNVILFNILFDHETDNVVNLKYLEQLEKTASPLMGNVHNLPLSIRKIDNESSIRKNINELPILRNEQKLPIREIDNALPIRKKENEIWLERSGPGKINFSTKKNITSRPAEKYSVTNETKVCESLKECEEYVCDDCGEKFSSFKILKLHLFEEGHKFHCVICNNFKTVNLNSLYNHSKDSHGLGISGKLAQHLNKCPYCPFVDDSLIKLHKHINAKHFTSDESTDKSYIETHQGAVNIDLTSSELPTNDLHCQNNSSISRSSSHLVRSKHPLSLDAILPTKKVRPNVTNFENLLEVETKKQSANNTKYNEIPRTSVEDIDVNALNPICHLCKITFSNIWNLKRHLTNFHKKNFESSKDFVDFVHSVQSNENEIYSFPYVNSSSLLSTKNEFIQNMDAPGMFSEERSDIIIQSCHSLSDGNIASADLNSLTQEGFHLSNSQFFLKSNNYALPSSLLMPTVISPSVSSQDISNRNLIPEQHTSKNVHERSDYSEEMTLYKPILKNTSSTVRNVLKSEDLDVYNSPDSTQNTVFTPVSPCLTSNQNSLNSIPVCSSMIKPNNNIFSNTISSMPILVVPQGTDLTKLISSIESNLFNENIGNTVVSTDKDPYPNTKSIGYICCDCSKFFAVKTEFLHHFKFDHSIKTKIKIVRFEFFNKNEINLYTGEQNNTNKIGYICSICQRYEDSEGLLRGHMLLTHQIGVNYQALQYKIVIAQNMEKSLDINYLNSLENTDLSLEELQTFYFSYVCKVCSQLFEIDSYFVTHLEHHHSKEKKFQLLKYQILKNNQCSETININIGFFCKMCSFYEITEDVMKAHMIYIHNMTNEYNVILFKILFDHKTDNVVNLKYLEQLENNVSHPLGNVHNLPLLRSDQKLSIRENDTESSIRENINELSIMRNKRELPVRGINNELPIGKNENELKINKNVIVLERSGPSKINISTKQIATSRPAENYSVINETRVCESLKECEEYVCDDCNEKFSSFKFLKLHLFEEEHTFHCSTCSNFKTVNLNSLYNHSKDSHGLGISGKLSQHLNKCPYCPFVDDSLIKLQKHINEKHLTSVEDTDKLSIETHQSAINISLTSSEFTAKDLHCQNNSINSGRSSHLVRSKHPLSPDVEEDSSILPTKRSRRNVSNSKNLSEVVTKKQSTIDSKSDETPKTSIKDIDVKALKPICHICKQTFKIIESLEQHLIKFHKNKFESSEEFFEFVHLVQSKRNEICSFPCDICKKEFKSKDVLIDHKIAHFFCKKCNYQALTQLDFAKHDEKVHNRPELFTCLDCSFVSRLNSEMKIHIKNVHHKTIQNLTKPQTIENSNESNPSTSKCFKCKKTFESIERLNSHLQKSKHGRQCAICKFNTASSLDFHCHNANEHQSPIPNMHKKNVLKCLQCSYFFPSSNALKNHVCKSCNTAKVKIVKSDNGIKDNTSQLDDKRKNVIKCNSCSFKCESYNTMECHRRKTNHKLMCDTCDFKTAYDATLVVHGINQHQKPYPSTVTRNIHCCSYCMYASQKISEVEKHLHGHKKKSPTKFFSILTTQRKGKLSPKQSKEYVLESRNAVQLSRKLPFLKKKSNIKKPIMTNASLKKPIKQSVPKQNNLITKEIKSSTAIPIVSSGKEQSLFCCNICKLTFPTISVLFRHRESKQHIIKCEYCVYETSKDTLLYTHLHNYHGHSLTEAAKKLVFKCSYCSHIEADVISLQNHVKQWHEVGEMDLNNKTWHCNQCSFKSTDLPDIVEHNLKIHQTKVEINCLYCSHVYSLLNTKDVLKHLQNNHKEHIKDYESNLFAVLNITKSENQLEDVNTDLNFQVDEASLTSSVNDCLNSTENENLVPKYSDHDYAKAEKKYCDEDSKSYRSNAIIFNNNSEEISVISELSNKSVESKIPHKTSIDFMEVNESLTKDPDLIISPLIELKDRESNIVEVTSNNFILDQAEEELTKDENKYSDLSKSYRSSDITGQNDLMINKNSESTTFVNSLFTDPDKNLKMNSVASIKPLLEEQIDVISESSTKSAESKTPHKKSIDFMEGNGSLTKDSELFISPLIELKDGASNIVEVKSNDLILDTAEEKLTKDENKYSDDSSKIYRSSDITEQNDMINKNSASTMCVNSIFTEYNKHLKINCEASVKPIPEEQISVISEMSTKSVESKTSTDFMKGNESFTKDPELFISPLIELKDRACNIVEVKSNDLILDTAEEELTKDEKKYSDDSSKIYRSSDITKKNDTINKNSASTMCVNSIFTEYDKNVKINCEASVKPIPEEQISLISELCTKYVESKTPNETIDFMEGNESFTKDPELFISPLIKLKDRASNIVEVKSNDLILDTVGEELTKDVKMYSHDSSKRYRSSDITGQNDLIINKNSASTTSVNSLFTDHNYVKINCDASVKPLLVEQIAVISESSTKSIESKTPHKGSIDFMEGNESLTKDSELFVIPLIELKDRISNIVEVKSNDLILDTAEEELTKEDLKTIYIENKIDQKIKMNHRNLLICETNVNTNMVCQETIPESLLSKNEDNCGSGSKVFQPSIDCLYCDFKSASYYEVKFHIERTHKDLLSDKIDLRNLLLASTKGDKNHTQKNSITTSDDDVICLEDSKQICTPIKGSDFSFSIRNAAKRNTYNPYLMKKMFVCSECEYKTTVLNYICRHMKCNHKQTFKTSNLIPKVMLERIL